MHALSLALALAAAPAAAPALAPIPVSAAAPSPVVRPALLAEEPAAPRGASAPVPVSAEAVETSTATPTPTSTSTPTSTPTSTSTSTSTPTSTPSSTPTPTATATTRPPPAPVPQAAVEKLGQGDRAFLAGDYRNALFAYQDAVYLAPRSATARVRLGRAYLALRYPPQATAQAEQALALDPESADAKQLLADAKTAPARPPAQPAAPAATTPVAPAPRTVIIERIPEATPAAEVRPAATSAGGTHVYRFTPEPETGGASAAESAATPTATPTPTPTPAREPAASDPPPDPVALREFGAVRVGAAAEPPPARVATPDPAGPTAGQRYRAALELLANREYERAVGELTQAIVLDPRLAVAYAARGSARFGLGRYREAADDYQTALVLDERLGTPLYGLAECYRVLGEGKRAAEMYQRYADSRASDVREDLRAISAKRAQELR